MMLSIVVSISTIITNAFLIVGVIIGICQLRKLRESNNLQLKSILADHERRKKQSTIEFYSVLYHELQELWLNIEGVFGEDHINPSDKRYIENIKLQENVYDYLYILERFAVGINTDIYDISVFTRTSGKKVYEMFERLYPVVKYLRIKNNYPEMFNDFEKMAKGIIELRKKMYPVAHDEDLTSIKEL